MSVGVMRKDKIKFPSIEPLISPSENWNPVSGGNTHRYTNVGLPYRPENSGHVRNPGLSFAPGKNFKKCSNVRNFMIGVLGELELRK